ncbi:hypothetical protein ACQPZZ_01875 [Microbispora sp. CA-135349]|uniref:hypothetical protein n=1 Tax=Microbispora sp. CA-135349 TaxID=3239953 RepID=UPI003D8EBD1F
MSDAMELMQLAAQGSQVLVAEMIKTGWEKFREALAALFGRGGAETESRHLDMLDQDRQQLEAVGEEHLEDVSSNLRQRWTIQLAAFLQQYPDTIVDLQCLLDQHAGQIREEVAASTFTALHNINSQVLQAGGDINTGGGDISYNRDRKDSQ